jgi:magnesium chelatase subunit I
VERVTAKPTTLGQLRASGHDRETVKQEMRRNLIARMRHGDPLMPGIVGYEETVLPQVANAIISGHDIILLGERGQAKSRLMRSLVTFLDPEIPVIEGCEINDHPYDPICRRCRDLVGERGDDTPVAWLPRDNR